MARTVMVHAKPLIRRTSMMLLLFAASAVQCPHSKGKDLPEATDGDKAVAFDSVAVINSLENRNRRPVVRILGGGPDRKVFFSKDYDWQEYDRVLNAVRILAMRGEEAFPELAAHLGDDRYCITLRFPISSVDMEDNESVGDICRMITLKWLSAPYSENLCTGLDGEVAKITYGQLIDGGVPRTSNRLKSWCERRKGRKLYELQIDTCKWVVSHVADVPYLRAEQRKAIADAVQSKIKLLETTKKAVRFEGFDFDGEEFRAFSKKTARVNEKEK